LIHSLSGNRLHQLLLRTIHFVIDRRDQHPCEAAGSPTLCRIERAATSFIRNEHTADEGDAGTEEELVVGNQDVVEQRLHSQAHKRHERHSNPLKGAAVSRGHQPDIRGKKLDGELVRSERGNRDPELRGR